MKTAMDRKWFERRVQLEEGLDVSAGLPDPKAFLDSPVEPKPYGAEEALCPEETLRAFGKLINLRAGVSAVP